MDRLVTSLSHQLPPPRYLTVLPHPGLTRHNPSHQGNWREGEVKHPAFQHVYLQVRCRAVKSGISAIY